MGESEPRRLLALAYEPWETQFIMSILDGLSRAGIEVELAIADYYHCVYHPELLHDYRRRSPYPIHDYSDIYKGWQRRGPAYKPDERPLESEVHAKAIAWRGRERLLAAEEKIFGWEEDFWLLPVDADWQDRILRESASWIQSLIQGFRPTHFLAARRNMLMKNLVWAYTSAVQAPMLTLIDSRVGARWIPLSNFGYGHDPQLGLLTDPGKTSIEAREAAESIMDELRGNSVGSYNSLAHEQTYRIEWARSNPVRFLLSTVSVWAKQTYSRNIRARSRLPFRIRRLEQRVWKLAYWEFRRLWRLAVTLRNGPPKSLHGVPSGPYILWTLHVRPETSTVVLGDGLDEVEAIHWVAKHLPVGWSIAVKENPLMFGFRHRDFYGDLLKSEQVSLIDPLVPTLPLIQSSQAVMGVSGTSLLEGAMLGRPAYAIGRPEFEAVLCGHGFDSVGDFLKDVREGSAVVDGEKVANYIAALVDRSSASHVLFDRRDSPNKMAENIWPQILDWLRSTEPWEPDTQWPAIARRP